MSAAQPRFNKSAIMQSAWELYHQSMVGVTYANRASKRLTWGRSLSQAWWEAKNPVKPVSAARQRARGLLLAHECKDRWTQADYALADELRAQVAA